MSVGNAEWQLLAQARMGSEVMEGSLVTVSVTHRLKPSGRH